MENFMFCEVSLSQKVEFTNGDDKIYERLECNFYVENLKFILQYFHLQIESFL